MTDVIGTADPDAPARRHRRVPRWLTWSAVALVAVAALVVPSARSRLADRAASWLRDEWSRSTSYDDARFAAIETVASQAGVLDDAIVAQATRVTDREVASALQHLVSAMVKHKMWSGDGDRARDAAVVATRDQVAALQRDARAAHPVAGYLFARGHDGLASRATVLVNALIRHHGVAPRKEPVIVTLRPDQSALALLRRPTDFPTGLSVVVTDQDHAQIVDLDSGRSTRLRLPRGDSDLQGWAGRIMVVSNSGVQALDARGRPVAHFGDSYAEVLSKTGPTVWLNGQQGVRRYAAGGRALTPWIHPPANSSPVTALGDQVVLMHVVDEVTVIGELWTPTTGAMRSLPRSCFGGWSAAGTTIVAIPCGGDREVSTVDVATGAVHRIRLGRPVDDSAVETFSPLSPDGRELSIGLTQLGIHPGLLDLRSGRFRPLPGDGTLTAAAWSADGQWVLLLDAGSGGNGSRPRVALWRPRDNRVTSVRLSPDSSVSGGLPLLSVHNG